MTKVGTSAVVLTRSARTCPEKNRKPAAPAACTFRRDPPRFARHFSEAPEQAVQQTQVRPAPAKLEIGHSDPWVATLVAASEASGIKILGHCCRVCRWYSRRSAILGKNGHCKTNRCVHMEVKGCSLQISTLRRHADSKQHRLAAGALQNGDGISSLGHFQSAQFRNSWSVLARVVWNRPGGSTAKAKTTKTPVWLGVCTKPCGTTNATF